MEKESTSSCIVNSKIGETSLQKEEDELADQLRKICDRNGEESNPKQSAEIFHKIGKIYFQRNTKVSLIRSATLFNAAITRQPDNMQEIKDDLKELCSHVLIEAGANKLDDDLITAAIKVEEEVQSMRNKVNKKLDNLKISQMVNKTVEEIENTKIDNIRSLQEQISTDYCKIMADLLLYCKTVMGNPPCAFALVGLGSLARKEITPYSDFEHIIVLKEKSDQRPDYKDILKYFRWLSVIFQIVLINLQETIVPSVDIKSFKITKNGKKENWFYDGITTRGISFDGMMPHACKFPLGQTILSGPTKSYKTELIKPVDEMLKYLSSHENLKSGYHLKDILTKVCYVAGDKSIFNRFQTKIYHLLDKENEEEKKKQIKKMLIEDLDNFATRSKFLKQTSKSFNIKKDLYRSTTIFISALGQVENIHTSSCFDILEALAGKGKLNEKLKRKLMFAVALACELRLKRYMKQKREDDNIKNLRTRQDTLQALLKEINVTNLISYFQIAYALQCDISKQFGLKKLHFYSDPKLLNCKLYYCFGYFEKFVNFTKENRAIKYNPKFRVQSADEILDQLENEAKLYQNQKYFSAWNQEYLLQDCNLDEVFNFGLQLRKAGNNDDAKEIFEIYIEIITPKDKQIKNESSKTIISNIRPEKKLLVPHINEKELQALEEIAS